ncbi:MAG: hypothetical protein ACRC9E_15480 [Plesiomonas shigelloides]
MEAIFAAIDLTVASTALGGICVAIIGLNMLLKGTSIGKRAVNKA